ncbi:hypothetical protein [Microbacterium oleivorans]|uniref:Uncharacterized protein n=1 Tax=Microbacterium oleivorans TaxID=273677 RepID=A0A031FPZ4_9MICO|nr:hypothetical protein [Microbacterium oleivorans]EZP26246.1 hypothetical protein BW34_02578 [Microbacterium oleivorans]|tara:strand:+ start:1795 stop:2055 length:261 start_codon:yes stop_codon:yes gene_type:complete
MTDSKTRVILIGGPLDGYEHEADVVGEGVALRFNSHTNPGCLQHIYHLQGREVSAGGPVYEYAGDDESNFKRLDHSGIDVPPHVFR